MLFSLVDIAIQFRITIANTRYSYKGRTGKKVVNLYSASSRACARL